MLALPDGVTACSFDLDGVLTNTAAVHDKAWTEMFNAYTFMAGARCVGVEPSQAAVFEDALAGVAAGRAGRFGWVVGVDRVGHAEALRAHGADVVVRDLAELLDDVDGPDGVGGEVRP